MTYLHFSDRISESGFVENDQRNTAVPASYKIMPYDNLFIRVITPDPQWSSLFNSLPVGAGGAVTEESAGLMGYPVDADGFIEIPFVGRIRVSEKTLAELKTELESIFKSYVTDYAITVRLVNNFVSVIGEVNIPGRYPLSKDRVNIFETIAMAGDLTEFGNRNKVQLIRSTPYGPVVKEFSLSDRSILGSELYYVMPNDIIYVQPLKGRSFQINSSIYTLLLTTLTSALVIIEFFR